MVVMNIYTIREMVLGDYSYVYALWSMTEGMGLSESDSEESIAQFLIRNKGHSYVCTDGDVVIGTVLCGHDGRRGFLYHVAVHNEYQNKGIARRLIERALNSLKEVGIIKCHLMVYANNDLGHQFWEYVGWIRRDEIVLYSKDM